jgi:2-amino-4-hydroxy-6-hydroxymethyldihydropteridine diphosphokinase
MNNPYIYYLGLGSNIEPALNIARALNQLQAQFHTLVIFPVLETAPSDIASPHWFYNSLVVMRSAWPPETLKDWCNQVEMNAGRDRSDPLAGVKDRPLDIDILAQQSRFDVRILERFSEPYVRHVIEAAYQGSPQCRSVSTLAGSLGEAPAAVDFDHSSGHIVVIKDGVDSLLQRFEPTLDSEQSLV